MKLEGDFIGYVKGNPLNDNQGRYLVYIPELLGGSDDENAKTLSLPNETNPAMFSRWLDFKSKQIMSAGSYFPLKEGMVVIVNFRGNTMESGYIAKIVSYLPLVDSQENRDSFYLLNKTIKGSWIYQDDNRGITHLIHNNGATNIVMKEDLISLQVGGRLQTNVIEVSQKGTVLQYENSKIRMDSTGIKFEVGDNVLAITENGIQIISSKNLDIESNSRLNIKSDKLKIQGSTDLNMYGNVVRLTGARQVNLNGNVVGITSTFLTDVSSNGQTNISSLVKTKISGAMLHLTSLGNVNLDGSVVTIGSQMTNISGTSLNLSGATIAMDGIINHGLGIGSALNTSMAVMNTALDLSTDAGNRAAVASLSMNSPMMSAAHTLIAQSLPGAAEMIGNIQGPIKTESSAGSGTKETLSYILNSNASYNNLVEEQFKDLRSTHEIYI